MSDHLPIAQLLGAVRDDSFAQRIEVLREAGRGGMGVVFEAVDKDGTRLAVKKLSRESGVDERRFLAEAEILESLDHEAIVRYVEHGATTEGEHYLVMSWLSGDSLAQHLRSRGPLSVEQTVVLAQRICSALTYAHQRGVIHRDLKPSNIILVDNQVAQAVLVDFGIARQVEAPGTLTDTGQIIGTPGYVAPEQIRGVRDVDGRVDLFALGCIIYECLAGRRAFDGDDLMPILARVLLEPPADIEQPIPRQLAKLLTSLLAKDRTRRPESAEDARRLLGEIESSLGDTEDVAPVVFDADQIATQLARPKPLPKAIARGLKRPKTLVALVVGIGVVAAVGLALLRAESEAGPCDRDRREGCQQRCEDGDTDACYLMGQGLVFGLGGLRKDAETGLAFLRTACIQRHGRACYEASGQIQRSGDDDASVSEVEELLVASCEHRFAGACRKLAAELDERDYLETDRVRARSYAKRACQLEDEFACERFARYLDEGIGGPVDSDEAKVVRASSCQRGHARACR